MGMMIETQYFWENKKWQPNHQPAFIYGSIFRNDLENRTGILMKKHPPGVLQFAIQTSSLVDDLPAEELEIVHISPRQKVGLPESKKQDFSDFSKQNWD